MMPPRKTTAKRSRADKGGEQAPETPARRTKKTGKQDETSRNTRPEVGTNAKLAKNSVNPAGKNASTNVVGKKDVATPFELVVQVDDESKDGKEARNHGTQNVSSLMKLLPRARAYETAIEQGSSVEDAFFSSEDGPATGFLTTVAENGTIRFWRKSLGSVEFVKEYRAHSGRVLSSCISADGSLVATAGDDKTIKVFNVANFDMINIIDLDFVPLTLSWLAEKGVPFAHLAVTDRESSNITIYDGRSGKDKLVQLQRFHNKPVSVVEYNAIAGIAVSVDIGGMVEYWDKSECLASKEPVVVSIPRKKSSFVFFEFKSETDLYTFKKTKSPPTSVAFSPDFSKFATYGFKDSIVRVFDFATGKIVAEFNDSVDEVTRLRRSGALLSKKLDNMEFDRRCAIETSLAKKSEMQLRRMDEFHQYKVDVSKRGENAREPKADPSDDMNVINGPLIRTRPVFDISGSILMFPTLLGVKTVHIQSQKHLYYVGEDESIRALKLGLYQGAPEGVRPTSVSMAASSNPLLERASTQDPTLSATTLKREQVLLFTRREPKAGADRNVAA